MFQPSFYNPRTLLKYYQQEPTKFTENQVVGVTGEVVQARTILNVSFITFKTDYDEESVVCLLSKSDRNKSIFPTVKKGENLMVSGKFDGRKDHIRLHSCEIHARIK